MGRHRLWGHRQPDGGLSGAGRPPHRGRGQPPRAEGPGLCRRPRRAPRLPDLRGALRGPRHRCHLHHHAAQHPHRVSPRRPCGRQARALREVHHAQLRGARRGPRACTRQPRGAHGRHHDLAHAALPGAPFPCACGRVWAHEPGAAQLWQLQALRPGHALLQPQPRRRRHAGHRRLRAQPGPPLHGPGARRGGEPGQPLRDGRGRHERHRGQKPAGPDGRALALPPLQAAQARRALL